MKKVLPLFTLLISALLIVLTLADPAFYPASKSLPSVGDRTSSVSPSEIRDVVKPGESMFDIFKKHGLAVGDLYTLKEASAEVHKLRRIRPGRKYEIELDADNNVVSLTYHIDEDEILSIRRDDPGFRAERVAIAYDVREGTLGGIIESSLVSSLGEDGNSVLLALDLSDIFSWDIDFNTDVRRGDAYRVVVEELWLNGSFRRYGNILAAEFSNDGTTHRAYRYEANGRVGYFDDDGHSLRRAFLKAPLSYRRISSGFSRRRFHPVLKTYRPHHGVDYAAARGTPVSALGEGTVRFAGWKGANGKLVILSHPLGYRTYYGHLSRIARGIRPGIRVRQGDVIGYVGSTGRATGPHLHFQINRNGRVLNPLTVNLPRGKGVPKAEMADFRRLRAGLTETLASIDPSRQEAAVGPADPRVASRR